MPVNQECTAREAAQVEHRSRMIMRGLASGNTNDTRDQADNMAHRMSRIQSPGKSQSGCRPINFSPVRSAALHGLREDFSPSPVISKKKTPVVNLKKLPNVIQHDTDKNDNPRDTQDETHLQELQEDEIVSSIGEENDLSELPTQVPFNPRLGRPSEADLELGFKVPQIPQKPASECSEVQKPASDCSVVLRPPSESSEVTFKIPSVPGVTTNKRKEPSTSDEDDQINKDTRYLHSWIPRLRKEKLYIEGDLLDLDASKDISSEMSRRYMTSKITSRISHDVVGTKKTIYKLEGPLAIKDIDDEKVHNTPSFIRDRFENGFPPNWERLIKHWILIEKQNKKNHANKTLISSTLISNVSSLANNTTFNASGLIKNLSIIKQPNISIGPTNKSVVTDKRPKSQSDEELPAIVEESDDVIESDPVKSVLKNVEKTTNVEEVDNEVEDAVTCLDNPEATSSEEDSPKQNKSKFCETCNKHYKNSNHSKTRSHLLVLQETMNKTQEVDKMDGNLRCNACQFSSDLHEQFDAHLLLQTHKNAIRSDKFKNLKTNIQCIICNFSTFRCDKFGVHARTKKHTKNYSEFRNRLNKNTELTDKINDNASAKRGKRSHKTSNDAYNDKKLDDVENEEQPVKKMLKGKNVAMEVVHADNDDDFVVPKPSAIKSKKMVKKSSKESQKIVEEVNRKSNEFKAPVAKGKAKRKKDSLEIVVTGQFKAPNVQVKTKKTKEKSKPVDPESDGETNEDEEEHEVNQSRFGRKIRQNTRYVRKSCVYNTPEETAAEVVKEPKRKGKFLAVDDNDEVVEFDPKPTKRSKAKKAPAAKEKEEPLRRTVLNPFKKLATASDVSNKDPAKDKDVGEILKKITAKPKTVKQRLQNVEALQEYNDNHEDDVFDEPVKKVTKTSTLATLLSQDQDSDSDQDISVHSARTPVTGINKSITI